MTDERQNLDQLIKTHLQFCLTKIFSFLKRLKSKNNYTILNVQLS